MNDNSTETRALAIEVPAQPLNATPVVASAAARSAILAALTLVCALSFVDSGLIFVLVQPIKHDLGLSDTQLGLMTGFGFVLFYATLGVPMARWADRGNRSTVVALSLGLWGLAVMGCLWVGNFAQLLLARVGAAAGDSGVKPATYSLLGDYFPEPTRRVRAMAVYWTSGPIAALISYPLGGWLNDLYGWRMTLFLMGIPGILVAVLFKMTIAEPRARRSPSPQDSQLQPRMWEVLKTLWCTRSARHLIIAVVLVQLMSNGMTPWYSAFLMRSHGMSTGEAGVWLGVIFGLGGFAGAVLGGYIAGRWFADNERGQMRLSAMTIGSLVAWFAAFLLLPRKTEALITLIPLIVTFAIFIGPTYALLQRLVVPEMRATSLAVSQLLASIIGIGMGPLIVGMLSDFLRRSLGADSLRYAMLAMAIVNLWAGYHLWRVGRTVHDDLIAVEGPRAA